MTVASLGVAGMTTAVLVVGVVAMVFGLATAGRSLEALTEPAPVRPDTTRTPREPSS